MTLTPTQRIQRYTLLRALETFAQQRPGIDPRNYGNWSDYRSESRRVTQDLHDFRVIMAAVERSELSAADILQATRAYSGRLEIVAPLTLDRFVVKYCTGQYFPTEYRRAACAVLAQALWDYHREAQMTDAELLQIYESMSPDVQGHPRPGEKLRKKFRRMFPRRIARMYFE